MSAKYCIEAKKTWGHGANLQLIGLEDKLKIWTKAAILLLFQSSRGLHDLVQKSRWPFVQLQVKAATSCTRHRSHTSQRLPTPARKVQKVEIIPAVFGVLMIALLDEMKLQKLARTQVENLAGSTLAKPQKCGQYKEKPQISLLLKILIL